MGVVHSNGLSLGWLDVKSCVGFCLLVESGAMEESGGMVNSCVCFCSVVESGIKEESGGMVISCDDFCSVVGI